MIKLNSEVYKIDLIYFKEIVMKQSNDKENLNIKNQINQNSASNRDVINDADRREKLLRQLRKQENDALRKIIKIDLRKRQNVQDQIEEEEKKEIEKVVTEKLGDINLLKKILEDDEKKEVNKLSSEYKYIILRQLDELEEIRAKTEVNESKNIEEILEGVVTLETEREEIDQRLQNIREYLEMQKKFIPTPENAKILDSYKNVMEYYEQNRIHDKDETEENVEEIKTKRKGQKAKDFVGRLRSRGFKKNKEEQENIEEINDTEINDIEINDIEVYNQQDKNLDEER